MTNNCADCDKGKITFHKVKDFQTKIQGVPFTVPEAEIGICDNCGARFYSPTEIRRWHQLYEVEEERTGRLLTAEQIQQIRAELSLPIHLFARLLGTTRQSVYNWERSDRKGPQLRIVDLLLRLIRESASTGPIDIVQFLSEQSGVELISNPSRRVYRARGRRRTCGWRDSAEYDRACNAHGASVALPRLRSY